MTLLKQHRGMIKPFYLIVLLILLSLATGFYWLADKINQQQEPIAFWVSEKLGHQVEISQAKLTWVNLAPKLELVAVKVFAEDDTTELLTLEKLYLDLDLYDSLRYTELRLDDITLMGLKIGVVRDQFGQIALKGLNQQGDSTPLFAELLVRSNALNSVHLRDITVDFTDQQKAVLTGRYQIDNALIQHQLNKWQANGLIQLPASLGESIAFTANWLLNEQEPERTTWQWTVEANEVQLAPLQNNLVFRNVKVKQGRVNAVMTGKGIGARLNQSQLALDLNQAQLTSEQEQLNKPSVIIDQLTTRLDWRQHKDGWSLTADELRLDMNDKIWPQSSFKIVSQNEKLEVIGDFLRIDDITAILAISELLPEQIEAQKPKGDIQNYQFVYESKVGLDAARFQLVEGQLSAWKDYPGIDNLTVKVAYAEQRAEIKLASQKVTISPATWLKAPLFFDAVSGDLALQFKTDSNSWQFESKRLNISNSDLNLFLDGDIVKTAQGEVINNIALTLDDIEVARWKAYVPEEILSQDFKEWADNAFLAGKIKQGRIHLKGDLSAFPYESEQDKTRGEFKMDLAVENVQLNYADAWPDLFDVTGSIIGQGNSLQIESRQGSIAGFAFKDVTVDIEKLIEAKPILTVDGQLAGTTQKALNFLRNSPLKERFGPVAKAVRAKGNSNIKLGLVVPLSDPDNTKVTGHVSFLDSHLYKKTMPKLGATKVTGRLKFTNNGVTSDKLTGQFLGQTVKVNVSPESDATVIKANSVLSSRQLHQTWPEQVPDFIEGSAPYELAVLVSERDVGDFYTDVTLTSNLKGMAITLPAPFQKSANQIKKLKMVFNQSVQKPSYKVNYANSVDLVMTPNAAKNMSSVDITLPQLNIDNWLAWSEQKGTQTKSPLSGLAKVTLKVDQLVGLGQQFSAVNVIARQQNKGWQVNVASPQIFGTVVMPEQPSNTDKVRVDLDKLMLALPEQTHKPKNKSSSLWPAIAINIADLSLSGNALGKIQLSARTEDESWVIEQGQLYSPVYQAVITKGRWSKSSKGDKTALSIRAESTDFAGLLERFGYQPSVEAKESKLDIALSWPDEPLAVSEKIVTGSLGFKLKKGKLNEIEPGTAGRVFGLMSIASVPRRLALDFNELFGKGLNYRSIRGDFSVANGIATTNRFKLKSEAAEIEITGPIDIVNQRYDQTVKITPNVSSTLPLAGAVAGGPIGLGVGTAILLADKLAGKLFDKDIVNVVSYNYTLTGPWQNPDLQTTGIGLPKQ
jgi:uncharacterized protein (TIGR02099 family)